MMGLGGVLDRGLCLKMGRNALGSVVIVSLYVLLMKVQPARNQEVMETTVGAEMRRLRGDLLKNYDLNTRPVRNQTHATSVLLYFDVKHIVGLDEKYQILTVKGEMMMKWKDEFLTWVPSSYSGISRIRLNSKEIWVPSVHSVYNAKTSGVYEPGRSANLLVYSNGSVKWYPEAVFDVPCNTCFRHYPFDSHNCSVLLNPLTGTSEISLDTIELPMSWSPSSVAGSAWELTRVEHKSLDPGDYYGSSVVLVRLFLQRTSRIYRYVCVTPTIVTLATSIFGFWLLPGDPSRYLIGCSNVILMSLSLQNLAATVPAGKDIPLIAVYSAAFLCMSGAFLLVTVINDLLRTSSGRPPQVLLRMSRHHLDPYLCPNLFRQSCGDRMLQNVGESSTGSTQAMPSEEENRRKDWEYVSLVVDRLSFCAFVLTYAVLLAVLASV